MQGSRLAFLAVAVVDYSCKMLITIATSPYQSVNLTENEMFVSNYLACPKPGSEVKKSFFHLSLTFLTNKLECLFI
jgi:hypothetical protein